MIRFKDLVFEDYFIDEHTAVITDKDGNVVEQHVYKGRPYVNLPHSIQPHVYCIQAHTKWGYKGPEWHVHHEDDNPLNNDIDNLTYMPRERHFSITNLGKPKTEACKQKLSEIMKGHVPSEITLERRRQSMLGKKDSDEVRKIKSEAAKLRWKKQHEREQQKVTVA